MARIRPDVILIGSFMSTLLVIGNAFYHKKQFYPSVVHLTKSNGSMAVLYFQAFVFALIIGKLMNKIFFGQLEDIEMEHLMERSWFALTETCLAFTVFRDDFSPKFVTLFTILFFLKCFHWLIEDRLEFMERTRNIPLIFHLRILTLSALLIGLDLFCVYNAYNYTVNKGASVQIVFGFEYAILYISILSTFFKYILHTIDLQNENPWDNRGIYMLYLDLLLGFVRVVLYFVFVGIMVKIHTFPLFAIRPIYLALRSFKKSVSDVVLSRRAIRNLDTMFPNVTAEQLSAYSDKACTICREEMNAESHVKKLGCSHMFHKHCLRLWFQRQQTCPICRKSILRFNLTNTNVGAPQQQPQQQQQQQPPQPQQPSPPQQQQSRTNVSNNRQMPNLIDDSQPNDSRRNNSPPNQHPGFQFTNTLPNIMPPFMFPPPPLPELNLSPLSDEELADLEGDERHNLEARIHCLRNINQLLDGAFIHIQQYMNITMANSHLENIRKKRVGRVENDLKYMNKEKQSSPDLQSSIINDNQPTTIIRGNDPLRNINDDDDNVDNEDINVIRRRRLDRYPTSSD